MEDLTTMDALYNKMGEYTKMEEELPFPEFQHFYQSLMDYLMKNYQDMNQEDLLKAKGMSMIVAANAHLRASYKDENRKKFSKMAEKGKFWEDAIVLNLTKSGMSKDEIDEKIGEMWE
ncbi:MAG: hypothetical protein Q4B50_07935 [Bacillota bacterium]|nr:hypothetical protein [Bacillota bacterium]